MWWSRTEPSAAHAWRVGQDTLSFDHSKKQSGEIFLIFQDCCLWKSPRKRQDKDAGQAARSHTGAAHYSISKFTPQFHRLSSNLNFPAGMCKQLG